MIKSTEFLRGISLGEDPFQDEIPEEELFYDLSGNEVSINETE